MVQIGERLGPEHARPHRVQNEGAAPREALARGQTARLGVHALRALAAAVRDHRRLVELRLTVGDLGEDECGVIEVGVVDVELGQGALSLASLRERVL